MIITRKIFIKISPTANSWEKKFAQINNGRQLNPNKLYPISASIQGTTGRNYRAFTSKEEIEAYMPEIIGASINDNKFHEKIEAFWSAVFIQVPATEFGMELDISFELFDGKTVEMFNKAPEDEKYKLGRPTNLTHYWQYRYCLQTSQVANNYELFLKYKGAKNIGAWLESGQEREQIKVKTATIGANADKAFLETMNNATIREGILRYFESGKTEYVFDSLGTNEEFDEAFRYADLTSIDMQMAVMYSIKQKCPNTFIKLVEDKTLPYRILIYKALDSGELRQPMGSSMILFGEQILGSTIDESITFLRKEQSIADAISARVLAKTNSTLNTE